MFTAFKSYELRVMRTQIQNDAIVRSRIFRIKGLPELLAHPLVAVPARRSENTASGKIELCNKGGRATFRLHCAAYADRMPAIINVENVIII
jgi:hypothetical protein